MSTASKSAISVITSYSIHYTKLYELIGDVRRVYTGTLTYGANWGDEVEQITFWDALDLVGVSFYEPLTDAKTASVATLRAGAKKALEGLRQVSYNFV